MIDSLKKFTLITGHYGCGKTNFSVNLAMDCKAKGEDVTIVDMDLVNPYFRTSDYRDILEEKGIKVITPVFGHTNLDIPSLPAAMYSIFESEGRVIVDVGGDDVGSTILGRFKPKFEGLDYDMLYVVNKFRNLTSRPEDAIEILNEIQYVAGGLKATGIVDNSHLMGETDIEVLKQGIDYTKEVCRLSGLPLKAVTVRRDLYKNDSKQFLDDSVKNFEYISSKAEVYPLDIYVKAAW